MLLYRLFENNIMMHFVWSWGHGHWSRDRKLGLGNGDWSWSFLASPCITRPVPSASWIGKHHPPRTEGFQSWNSLDFFLILHNSRKKSLPQFQIAIALVRSNSSSKVRRIYCNNCGWDMWEECFLFEAFGKKFERFETGSDTHLRCCSPCKSRCRLQFLTKDRAKTIAHLKYH